MLKTAMLKRILTLWYLFGILSEVLRASQILSRDKPNPLCILITMSDNKLKWTFKDFLGKILY